MPMIYTLEGLQDAPSRSRPLVLGDYADSGNRAVYNPGQSYRGREFATLGGGFNLFKLSTWDKPFAITPTLKTIGRNVNKVADLGKYAPFIGPYIETGLKVWDIGNGLFRVQDKDGTERVIDGNTGFEVKEEKKTNIFVPIAIGVVGLLAAIGIAS